MNNNDQTISVELLGKEYRIACPPEARQDLDRAAQLLNKRMQEVKSQGKLYGVERVAIMTALNLAHELLNSTGNGQYLQKQLSELNHKIENALSEDLQIDFND